jgi:lysozyme family protein
METNWGFSLKAIRQEEGGNDDDPNDPGGRTSRGIIQREYNAYCKRKRKPLRDVWQATDAEVDEIYHDSYWLPWGPRLPSGVDLMWFNMGVNAGPTRSTILLQRALGVNDDGHIGIVTIGAIEDANPIDLVKKFANECRKYYRSLRTYRYFGKGWMNRTAHIEAKALRLIPDQLHRLVSHTSDDSQSA